MSVIKTNDLMFLTAAEIKLQSGEPVAEAIDLLMQELSNVRQQLSAEEWRQFVMVNCRQHPLMELLQQDPFIWRALNKPRGYAGDGETMDFMFAPEDGFVPSALDGCTELGKRLNAHTTDTEVPRAVRSRRRIIAEKINAMATRKSMPHVLSLACGHLREAKYCIALQEGSIGRFVAIDHDRENLAVVEHEWGVWGVEPVLASVRDILRGRILLSDFDFVYVAGLYDYLTLPMAQRLTEILFNTLNPGGRLVIANYVSGISYAAFIESVLDWWLIYRSRPELLTVAETLPHRQIASYSICMEDYYNIALLEVERK